MVGGAGSTVCPFRGPICPVGAAAPGPGVLVQAGRGFRPTNGWTLAEQAGDLSPDGMQRLLRWADWDTDAVRDDVRDYQIKHLGDPDGCADH